MNKNVIYFYPETTIENAIKDLLHFNISGAPVINEKKEIIGVISITDIIKFVNEKLKAEFYLTFSSLGLFIEFINFLNKAKILNKAKEILKIYKVKDLMNKNVICVNENDSLESVIEKMVLHDISRVFVVNNEKKLVGIITKTDILRFLLK